MRITDVIRNFIRDNIDITVYLEFLPATPDTCIALYALPSSSLDMKHSYSTSVLSFRSRGSTLNALSNLEAIERLIHGYTGTLQGTFIVSIQALQKPYSTGRDTQDRQVMAQNYLIEFEDTNARRLI